MKKFEYNIVLINPETSASKKEKAMNFYGKDGWELTAAVSLPSGYIELYFKRECVISDVNPAEWRDPTGDVPPHFYPV